MLRWAGVTVVAALLIALPGAGSVAAEPGDEVQIAGRSSSTPGYAGSAMFGVYQEGSSTADSPDFWGFCIEHNVTARDPAVGVIGDIDGFLGENYFATDTVARAKVLWIIANSFPALSLTEFAAASGVADISQDDATEAAQYAIWRFTELNFDAPWAFETPDSEAAYWYLLQGAHDSGGLTPGDLQVTVSLTAPGSAQIPDSLAGPFVVTTNQLFVIVSVDPVVPLVDASGDPIDPHAVGDGDELYLDLRGVLDSGSATVRAMASGATSGLIVSVPTADGGSASTASHAQSLILVAPALSTTTARADIVWEALSTDDGTDDSAGGGDVLSGSGAAAPLAGMGLALSMLLVGIALLAIRRRRGTSAPDRRETDLASAGRA